jgi:hypothetical protein
MIRYHARVETRSVQIIVGAEVTRLILYPKRSPDDRARHAQRTESMKKPKPQTTDAIAILHKRFYEGKPRRLGALEEARNADEAELKLLLSQGEVSPQVPRAVLPAANLKENFPLPPQLNHSPHHPKFIRLRAARVRHC